MKRTTVFLSSIFIFISTWCCADAQINFIEKLLKNPKRAEAFGLGKLTEDQQKNLNVFLNKIYQIGVKRTEKKYNRKKETADTKEKRRSKFKKKNRDNSQIGVYITKIYKKDNELNLKNGGIVKLNDTLDLKDRTANAVLFKVEDQWKIWIEHAQTYDCELVKHPKKKISATAQLGYLSEIQDEGVTLVMFDGSKFTVAEDFVFDTSLWFGNSDVLILNNKKLVNLDEGNTIIDIHEYSEGDEYNY